MLNIKKVLIVHKDSILRLALVLFIIAYFPYTPFNMLAAALHTRFAPHFEGGGIGGMAYTESELEEINVDNEASEAGMMVPVPEEYLATQPLLYSAYTIQKGDMIGVIAENFGLNQGTLVSINNIRNSRAIYPNEILRIPNQDGIMHTVASGETIAAIAEKYTVEQNSIITANELFSDKVNNGTRLFVPGAKLNFMQLQEINGDLFVWPVRGRITSRYGYRISPVSGSRMFHTGIDVSAVTGVPIRAAMSGRISTAGYNDVFGYHVVIAHHSNYRTLYGHMSAIRTRSGAYVKTGEVIGYVGNTGQSTGSHLHFTVYKNGVTINPLLLMN